MFSPLPEACPAALGGRGTGGGSCLVTFGGGGGVGTFDMTIGLDGKMWVRIQMAACTKLGWGVRPYAEQCAVCWESKRVFKKMHRSQRDEQPHLVCLDCHRMWVRACNVNRASHAPEERVICPICVRSRCYTLSMSVYVACWACQQLKKSMPFLAHGGRHVAERHPGCTLCWECMRDAIRCPMCRRQGPLIERPIHESVWGEAQ